MLTACGKQAIKSESPLISQPQCQCAEKPQPVPAEPCPGPDTVKTQPNGKIIEVVILDYSLLRASGWEDLNGFAQEDLVAAWPAWLQSCSAIKTRQAWQAACEAATKLNVPDNSTIAAYFRQYFVVYRATNSDGTDSGLITGYYEPILKGSRSKTPRYQYPLYAKPNDLITVELGDVYPELANKRVRGRLLTNKLVPYYKRGEIEVEASPLKGNELLWLDDPVEAFFLQIQGSGLVQLDSGEQVHVGYADQNGHAYNSIGKLLIERGELTADKASMQGIKDWARANSGKLRDLLNNNPSYVFFRELPSGLPGPLGALGVPILAERSVAVDPRFIPLGAPVFLDSTFPNSSLPLKRLMMAQDTGGAIKGGVRADFFWGSGNNAGKQAGAMKQQGRMWVLLPKEFQLPNNTAK